MKKTLTILFALLLLTAISSRAGIIFGSLSAITTAQTNSPTFITNTATLTLPTVIVSNGGLSATNSYTGWFRWSFDGTTFFTNSSPAFNPATTNAGSTTIYAQTITVPIQVQMLAITNTANVGTITIGATTYP